MLKVVLLIIACAFFVTPLHAACTDIATVRKDVAAWNDGSLVTELKGDALAAFVRSYNAMPPVTNFQAEHLVVVSHHQKPAVILVSIKGGCVERVYSIPRDTFLLAMIDRGI